MSGPDTDEANAERARSAKGVQKVRTGGRAEPGLRMRQEATPRQMAQLSCQALRTLALHRQAAKDWAGQPC